MDTAFRLNRRRFIGAAGAVAFGAATVTELSGVRPADAADAADEFDALRARWRDLVLGTGFDPTVAPYAGKLATLGELAERGMDLLDPRPDALFADYSYADDDKDLDQESYAATASIANSYARLNTMAQAWAQPGTGVTGDAALLNAIRLGLDHLYDDVYNEDNEYGVWDQVTWGNWWHWQIGAPRSLMETCTIVYNQLSSSQIANFVNAVHHFVPDAAVSSYTDKSTGANRVDLARAIALSGVIGDNADRLATARDALSPVFPYVTSGDGLYADGSFIQHTYVPYTMSYGTVMLDGLGRLFSLFAGSSWEITDPDRQIIFDAVVNAYAPFIYNGLGMDTVAGRAIARGVSATSSNPTRQDDHIRGHALIATIATLAPAASSSERATWHGMIKGWIERDTVNPVLRNAVMGVADLSRLQTIADGAGGAAPEPVEHRLFPAMDRAVHRRSGWAAAIGMSSARIAYHEWGNGENLRGWHTGNGMLYWWGSDFANGQYSDDFWPTVDPYRLPGTTVSSKPLADGEGAHWGGTRPDAIWVGGATDGTYGTVGQYARGLSSTLTAKKSWFCLDDAIVCLGSQIKASDGVAVETIVENRNLGANGAHAFVVDGVAQGVELGWNKVFDSAAWAHIAGHGGYVFPGGASFNAEREARTGAWSDINSADGATDPITRRYLTMWFDHGVDPTGDTYAYILLPGASAQATAARATSDWLEILVNNGAVHGISVEALGFTGVNFWNAGAVGPLAVSAPAAVQIVEHDGTATICVSGADRGGATIELTWNRAVTEVLANDPSITVQGTGSSLRLSVASGTVGATHTCTVVPA